MLSLISEYACWWCVIPLISCGMSRREFLLQRGVFQPGIRSTGHPDSTSPPSHHVFSPQSSLEASSPVYHTGWISWTRNKIEKVRHQLNKWTGRKKTKFSLKGFNSFTKQTDTRHVVTWTTVCGPTSQNLQSSAPHLLPTTNSLVWCPCESLSWCGNSWGHLLAPWCTNKKHLEISTLHEPS